MTSTGQSPTGQTSTGQSPTGQTSTDQTSTSPVENVDTTEQGGAADSTVTVLVALLANAAIAVAKTAAAVVTGSASMLAESAHSWADTANEVLLLVADRRSRKTPDQAHPLGYGREAYVWSLFAALGLFTVGAVVSVWHGVTSLRAPEESTSFVWAYAVLAIAFVLEGTSFLRALRQTGVEAQGLDRDLLEHALTTSDPTLRAVLAEDAAALVGLVVAFAGVLAHQLTANPMWDALGSILVGLVLGAVAVVLIQRNTSFLTGRAGDDRLRDAAVARLREVPQIERVTYLRLEFVGPRQLVLLARVDLRGDLPESQVAATVRDVERELERRPTVVEALISLATSDEPSI